MFTGGCVSRGSHFNAEAEGRARTPCCFAERITTVSGGGFEFVWRTCVGWGLGALLVIEGFLFDLRSGTGTNRWIAEDCCSSSKLGLVLGTCLSV